MKRNCLVYFGLIILTIALGLASRQSFIPDFIYPYIGDAFYAVMIFFGLGFLFPRLTSYQVLILCIATCFSIEISQLYQAKWINDIRESTMGSLVLGHGFLWSDLASYTVGAGLAFILELKLPKSWKR